MWFKNLQLYRLPANWNITASALEDQLSPFAFGAATGLQMQGIGFTSPRDNGQLVHAVDRQLLIRLTTEKKLLPASIINQVAKEKAAELEAEQGYKPGKKQMKALKEQVADELLPRAFSLQRHTHAWIDPVNGWLVVDAASTAKADDVHGLLVKAIDPWPGKPLRVNVSPASAMTSWLLADEAPSGFTIDQDAELRQPGETKSTVRYIRHTLDPKEVREHIGAGKACVRLGLTWNDRISFVLTDSLAIKRVSPLDVLQQKEDAVYSGKEEEFDSDMALMAGEVSAMLADLVHAMGGEVE
jgi:recombination associated protein RdgC